MPTPSPGPFAPTVSFITLAVADVARARRFYSALGLVADRRSGDRWAFFQLQGIVLALIGPDALEKEWGGAAVGDGARTALSHNVTDVALIDAILACVQAAGGTICVPRGPNAWGGQRAWFADPDGHRWEVVYNPRIHRDAHGGVWLDGAEPP